MRSRTGSSDSFIWGIVLLSLAIILAGDASAQTCTPAPPRLVAWWPGDGNYKDTVGHNDGTPVGAGFGTGEVDQAFSLNGASSVQVSNSAALDITGDLTIEAWINPASSARGYIVVKGNGNDNVNAYSLRYGAGDDRSLLLSVADGSTGNPQASYFESFPGVVPVGIFSHIAVTVQGTTATIYVNGTQVAGQYLEGHGFGNNQESIVGATQLTANRLSDHGAVTIGNGNISPIPFSGLIDELSVYNRALSASEIHDIFTAGASGKCQGCPVDFQRSINLVPDGLRSLDGKPTSMKALFCATGFQWRTNDSSLGRSCL
jgi:hypothetical protein